MAEDQLNFYKFCDDSEALKMENFNYLKKSQCFMVPEINDKKIFEEVSLYFNNLGFTKEEQDSIYRTLSLVLNLGNIKIDDSKYEYGGSVTCSFVKDKYFTRVLELLGVQEKQFTEGCCALSRKFIETVTLTPRTKASCENIRDALAKDLFNNCFSWIVRKLNLTLAPTKKARYISIGLLDIFGFEDFKINSIEQFCINYTNEKLQNLYISYVFKAERVIFEAEGLSQHIGMISYDDNEVIIAMLDKAPAGIFHLLDSSCKMSNGDDEDDKKLVEEIKKFHSKDNRFFSDKLNHMIFGIKHTAKDVKYTTNGFVEKNKDELPENLLECLKLGEKELMKIFQGKLTHDEEIEEKVKNPKDKYLGYKFRAEM